MGGGVGGAAAADPASAGYSQLGGLPGEDRQPAEQLIANAIRQVRWLVGWLVGCSSSLQTPSDARVGV